MFIIKKLNRNGNWDTISLYDENNSFRGEARFESKSDAEAYLKLYKERMDKKLLAYGRAKNRESFKIFELDGKSIIEEKKRKYGHSFYISPLL